ncbi:MAG: hypothetical protein ACXQT2_02110 [Methanotrichaceae archaeon]
MNNEVFDAIRKRVEEEPYAQKLGLRLIKLDRGYSLAPGRDGTTSIRRRPS